MVKKTRFHGRGHGIKPWSGIKIPHATWHSPKIGNKNSTGKRVFFARDMKDISLETKKGIEERVAERAVNEKEWNRSFANSFSKELVFPTGLLF